MILVNTTYYLAVLSSVDRSKLTDIQKNTFFKLLKRDRIRKIFLNYLKRLLFFIVYPIFKVFDEIVKALFVGIKLFFIREVADGTVLVGKY